MLLLSVYPQDLPVRNTWPLLEVVLQKCNLGKSKPLLVPSSQQSLSGKESGHLI